MLLFSHPTGNANVRHAMQGLAQAGLLGEFHTAVALYPGNLWDRLSGFPGGGELKRRAFEAAFSGITRQYPARELGRLACGRLGLSCLAKHETGMFSIDAVYRSVDRRAAQRLRRQPDHFSGVYAYEDGAATTFQAARSLGKTCFYDLPIGHWRAMHRLLNEERSRWPDWAGSLGGFRDSAAKLERKDEELRQADLILVASTFTETTLRDFPGPLAPVKIIPYGFPEISAQPKAEVLLSRSRPLKMLFVGGLSQRKGIADVFAVAESLKPHVELTVVGGKSVEDCLPLNAALTRHRWIPSLSHAKILELMREHDVLLFPSLFEGFGLVMTEAMSQGTPVITTDRTAGTDIIQNGENGWLVAAGSTEALKAAVEELLKDPTRLARAGNSAREAARIRPWEVYGRELAEAVSAFFTQASPGQ